MSNEKSGQPQPAHDWTRNWIARPCARAGYIDCEVLKARYLEEDRPYLLSKYEWHDQALEL